MVCAYVTQMHTIAFTSLWCQFMVEGLDFIGIFVKTERVTFSTATYFEWALRNERIHSWYFEVLIYTGYAWISFLLDEDGNNQWPEGLKFLFDSVSSQNVGLREAALHIFWYTHWSNLGGKFNVMSAQSTFQLIILV